MFIRDRAEAAAAAASLPSAGLTQPSSYPNKPIRIVVAWPPGSLIDVMVRIISEPLREILKQPLVIDNKAGATGVIGAEIVANAAPDGYTLLFTSAALNMVTAMGTRQSFKVPEAFTPVLNLAWSPMVLVTHPSVPAKNVNEFLALAKARPGKINFASGGIGTGAHLALELFKTRAGVDVTHVPYKGNGPATSDLLGGQVSAMFLQYAVAKPHVAGGKLVMLATPSGKRSPAIPDVPTIAESGLPGFDVEPWFGIVAPAGTPAAIVNRLNAEIGKIMQQNDVKDLLASFGAAPSISSPQEFGKFIDSEVTRWAEVVKASGAKAE